MFQVVVPAAGGGGHVDVEGVGEHGCVEFAGELEHRGVTGGLDVDAECADEIAGILTIPTTETELAFTQLMTDA